MRSAGEGDREKMRRPVLENFKVCAYYDKETHRCLADGTSVCLDPQVVKEEDCETAREATNVMTKYRVIHRFSRTGVR